MADAGAKKKQMEAEDLAICKQYNLKTDDYCRVIVKRRSFLDLRTASMRTDGGNPKQGRIFDPKRGMESGGIRVDEMIYGLNMAHLSSTDDTDERLEGASPNCMAAMEKIVGGDQPEVDAMLPLSQILKERFDLNLDCLINESGFRKNRFVDTQGFIASNDDTIVLSYRFSTSLSDWIANLSMTSSEWRIADDEALGHAGVFSCSRGWFRKFCRPDKGVRPRVHTAYYNNFIYTIPMIRKYIIDPLVKNIKSGGKEGAKPKKIYIAGGSLGAAISQVAYCFILDELYPYLKDPDYKLVDRLISVTYGCPRVGDKRFCKMVQKKMDVLRKLDRAVICRIVYNIDIIPHAPPNILGFYHLDKLVYVTRGGKHVLVNPKMRKGRWNEMKTIFKLVFEMRKKDFEEKRESKRIEKGKSSVGDGGVVPEVKSRGVIEEALVNEKEKTPFEIETEGNAELINNHMPWFYMEYMENLKEKHESLLKEAKDEKFGICEA